MATIRRHGNNWQAIIRKTGFKPKRKTFRTQKMAQDWARKTEDLMAQGHYIDRQVTKMSVPELLDRYLTDITPRKKSAKKEASRIRILREYFEHIHLANLKPDAIVEYVDHRLQTVKADTVRKEMSTLSHAIETGMALWGVHMIENPVKAAKRILSATRTLDQGLARDRRVTLEEEKQLLAEAENYGGNLASIIRLAIRTAMRRQEISRLCYNHVNEKLGTLYIPDTKSSRNIKSRTIPLPADILSMLKALAKSQDDKTKPLFGLSPDSITQAFTRVTRRVGIEGLRFHDLRHEATSRLFESGWSIEEVRLVTGHSDLTSLLRYTHLRPENLVHKFQ